MTSLHSPLDLLAAPSASQPTLELRTLRSSRPADLADTYRPFLPAFRRWYRRKDAHPRPDLATARSQLVHHMPELEPAWRELCEALAPDDRLLQTMFTGWDPPSLLHNCSTVLMTAPRPVLARNYDYDPALIDGVVVDSAWAGVPVLGTADQVWGLLDGVNGAGLAVSFTFGGRREEGRGFGIPMVLRYLLQTATTVEEAVRTLRRLPIHVAYNVSLLDSGGDHATVFVGPDRPAHVTRQRITTNHQERVHWPEHDSAYRSTERQAVLRGVLQPHPLDTRDDAGDPVDAAVAALLTPPVRADRYAAGFGTLYTAVYDVAAGSLSYHWPGQSWQLRLGQVQPEQRTVRLGCAAPASPGGEPHRTAPTGGPHGADADPQRWAGSDWAANDWSAVDWAAVDWAAIDWAGIDWAAVDWSRPGEMCRTPA